jgi:hypothetical protein
MGKPDLNLKNVSFSVSQDMLFCCMIPVGNTE